MTGLAVLMAAPAGAEVPDCMVGRWQAETGHLTAFYQALTPAPVTRVDGDIVMEIAADGSGRGTISNFEIEQPVGGQRMINAAEGSFAFEMEAEDARFSTEITDFTVTIAATMHGGAAPQRMAEVTQGIEDLAERQMAGTFTCSADALALVDDEPRRRLLPAWRR
ncbi:hypothetical protein [Algicella marina]|uniref:Uncharacterized protein n=1 Tax=Algicella marina TaxID=2683284 RepID=A0A6P1T6U4_9RHOB|nr:hypothetical protein [Algicella marina]QHQ36999.1 hypothetical protein GO499_18335 [Algicella marina]